MSLLIAGQLLVVKWLVRWSVVCWQDDLMVGWLADRFSNSEGYIVKVKGL